MIYGSRVRQAREFREVRQGELASLLSITGGRLAQIESSTEPVSLSQDQADALSAALRMPVQFFTVPVAETLSEGSMRFRARRTVTQRILRRARREAELTHEIAHACLRVVDAPPARVPILSERVDVEEAAAQARATLAIAPDEPIANVIRAVERAGVWVFAIDTGVVDKLDAFSTWTGPTLDRPVLALAHTESWDRARHTVAHELGHFVLHRSSGDDVGSGEDHEKQADRFASAFLLPRDVAEQVLPSPFVLSKLMPVKLEWGLSMQALITRAHTLGLITSEHRTSMFKQLSARQWRTTEPGSDARPVERPRALRRMVELAYGQPIDVKRLAAELGRYPTDIARDLERYMGPPGSTVRRETTGHEDGARVIQMASRRRA